MTQKMQHFSLKVLTINIHKGFTAFNRRFILPELRDAVRTVSADIVCLQEVMGAHEVHPLHFENWPDTPHYEFLADTIWSDYAYGRNAVYPDGHHGNALLSKYPIIEHRNLDVSITGPERRGLLHCVLDVPGQGNLQAFEHRLDRRECCLRARMGGEHLLLPQRRYDHYDRCRIQL